MTAAQEHGVLPGPGTPSPAPEATTGIEEIATALDSAMGELASLEPSARAVVDSALDSLNDLHKRALVTIVRRLKDDPRGKELLFELVDDPELRMVLAMHRIIRPDPATLARQVLDRVRPGLVSHGGDVQLDSIRGTTAYVRLEGACNGCSMASVTMRDGVTEALLSGVPGLTGVEVVPNSPSPTLIPVSALTIGPPLTDAQPDETAALEQAGWSRTVSVDALGDEDVTPARAGTTEVIVLQHQGQVAAYVNRCAHQGLPLDNALLDPSDGTLTCPWHGLCYDATTGECTSLPGAQLQQLPVRLVGGDVWVRPGGGL